MFKYLNNYQATLTASITADATSMTVSKPITLGVGEVCRLTIQNDDASLFEIVDVTAVSGTTLTVERGKDGTASQSWESGSVVVCSITAEQAASIQSNEKRKIVSSSTFTSANGRKQKFVATANATMNFAALATDDYIDLLVNPATYTLTWTNVNWQNGTEAQITASKLNRVLIENDDGVIKAYIVSN